MRFDFGGNGTERSDRRAENDEIGILDRFRGAAMNAVDETDFERALPRRLRAGFLMKRGLILRAVASYGLPDCLRLTVGPEEANRLVVQALADFMAGRAP